MNKNLSPEKKKKYEREFCNLLARRITDAGGSLPFQHLSGLIQQARFEIRDAFGTSKKELMKFLKDHPKIFQTDSAGMVTYSDSPFSDDDTEDICTNREIKRKKNLPPKIDKGIGFILREHTGFVIIKATEPIETLVHFETQVDSPLKEGVEVYFNAVLCHDNYDHNDINYSASKVWLQEFDKCENSNKTRDPPVSNELNGQGIVKKLWPDCGSISSNRVENIFFHKNSIKDCDCDDLTQFLKIGDSVEFSATKLHKDNKTSKWQATSVRKKSQNVKSSTHTNPVKSKLENEPGKIYPNSTGAIIKFGKNFAEQADGNSCSYFLYGGEVTDIKWEFSEGDDVFFDAVKTKSAAKWKAVLVWVGEKPVCFNYKKTFSDNKIEVSEDESVSSSISHCSKPMTKRSQSASKSKRVEQNEMLSNHSNSRRYGRHDERFKKQTSNHPNSENILTRKSRNGSERNMNEKDNSFVNRRGRNKNRRGNERKFPSEVEPKKSLFNKNATATYESDEEVRKTAYNFQDHLTYKDDHSNSSQDDSNEDVQGISVNDKYLVTKRADKSSLGAPMQDFSDESDNDIDNTCNQIKSDNKKMASIKKFDDVEGKIKRLHCKAAFIESSCLEMSVDFMLNAFYLNGKNVEEQQVDDLKEVIKMGDVIKFNFFEIVDDKGEVYKKVTMAWKGPKPEVYEMTPEEFISEHDLSVTINKQLEPASLSSEIMCTKNLSGGKYESSSESSASESEEVSDDKDSTRSKSDSIDEEEREEDEDPILDVNKSLSETALERLKYKGLIPSDVQVNISGLLTEVTILVQKHCDRCNSRALSEPRKEIPKTLSKPICPLCEKTLSEENKSENQMAAQTIITGGIIAQSIYTQP